jgi:hypothetical protein
MERKIPLTGKSVFVRAKQGSSASPSLIRPLRWFHIWGSDHQGAMIGKCHNYQLTRQTLPMCHRLGAKRLGDIETHGSQRSALGRP